MIRRNHCEDRSKVWDLLAREICSDDLDRVANRLWWMSKQDSGNISPLHRQVVKQRTIVVTEDPKLHLAWIHDRIFIKPLPRYITSYAFWRDYLCTDAGGGGLERIRRAALGYLRTYYHLVKHESVSSPACLDRGYARRRPRRAPADTGRYDPDSHLAP